jgi:hypothetical protein
MMFDNGGAYDKMNIRKELPRYKKERDENDGKGPTTFKQLIGYEDDGKIDERDEG